MWTMRREWVAGLRVCVTWWGEGSVSPTPPWDQWPFCGMGRGRGPAPLSPAGSQAWKGGRFVPPTHSFWPIFSFTSVKIMYWPKEKPQISSQAAGTPSSRPRAGHPLGVPGLQARWNGFLADCLGTSTLHFSSGRQDRISFSLLPYPLPYS